MATTSRYFVSDKAVATSVNSHVELIASLERIHKFNPPVQTGSAPWTFNGIYNGPTSIAYLFYRLHLIYPDLRLRKQSLLDLAEAYLDLSSNVPKADPTPTHCGVANETLAFYAIKAVMLQDESLATKLCSYQTIVNSTTESGSNEWLYGRAGYLYFLRLAESEFDAEDFPTASQQIADAIRNTVERILSEPQPWVWHDTLYLGAAHGIVGIICNVVLAEPASAPRLQHLLQHILSQQYASGNFPSSLPAGSDNLVQFCHGAPGFISSLETILPYFPKMKGEIEEAINKARRDVVKRGLLTKDPCLCHGIAGNALALESHEQMQYFLTQMTSTAIEKRKWLSKAGISDEFSGLYVGEAGRAWAWAVLDERLPRTYIGYNDL